MKLKLKIMYHFFLSYLFFIFSISCFAQIDPIAHYPFLGSAEDVSGNGYHGSVQGAILTEDRFGNPNAAYSFDGINDYIGVYAHLPALESGTINFWFAPDSNLNWTSDYSVLIEMDTAGDVSGEFLVAFNRTNCFSTAPTMDGKIYFELQGDEVNANDPDCPGFGLVSVSTENDMWEAQKWQMITVVKCAEAEMMKIYHNGEFVEAHATTSNIFTGDRPFYIGKFATDSPQEDSPFHGAIDDVIVFEDCLDLKTIRDLYNQEDPLSIKNTHVEFPSFHFNNPVNETLIIHFDEYIPSIKFVGYNSLGQRILTRSFPSSNSIELSVKDWKPGIYFIQFEIEQQIHTIKLIKD